MRALRDCCCLAGLLAWSAVAAGQVDFVYSQQPSYGSVRLTGPFGDRFDRLVANHVLPHDAASLADEYGQRRFRVFKWQTEFWGKYMHAAIPVWQYTGDEALRRRIDSSVASIIATQEPDGYIGDCAPECRPDARYDVWDIKYTLLGLLHHYDGTGDRKSLDAAVRLGDWLIGQFGAGGKCAKPLRTVCGCVGQQSCSVLEPIMWLHRRTGERRFLDFAGVIVRELCEAEDGPRLVANADVPVGERCCKVKPAWCDWKPDLVVRKAYEQMSCYQGLIEYSEVTGRREYFDAALKTARSIAETEINLAGGASAGEFWFGGAAKQTVRFSKLQETCVLTTWMRLCEKLLTLTGDPRWAEEIEKTFFNAYLASMGPDCDVFAAYTPLVGYRSRGYHNCFRFTNCCNENGPRGYLTILRTLLQGRGDAALLNQYVSGTSKVKLPSDGREVSFYVYTTYPRENRVSVWNRTPGTQTFALKLRVPSFSAKTKVLLNGQPLTVEAKAGGYCEIRRAWRNSDCVELVFDMPVVMHRQNGHVAFTRGPVCLARDSRFNDGALDDEIRANLVKPQVLAGFGLVRAEDPTMFMAMAARLPTGSHDEDTDNDYPAVVHFTDFASAGNRWTPENRYRVWLPELVPGR